MVEYKIVVAYDKEGGIGYKNQLPWKPIPEDMVRFKSLTKGNGNNSVIMGWNTWMSLSPMYRPLPDRVNIILTRKVDKVIDLEHIVLVPDIEKLTLYVSGNNSLKDHWIIGGARMYRLALDCLYISEVWTTEINKKCKCDKYINTEHLLRYMDMTYNIPLLDDNKNTICNFKRYLSNERL